MCLQGRPTEATGELERPAYGAVSARDYIPGAEVLDPEQPTEDDGRGAGDEVRKGEGEAGTVVRAGCFFFTSGARSEVLS